MVSVCVFAQAPLAARQSTAVNPQAYVNAIDEYVTGHELPETVMTLQLWTRKDFEAAVDRLILERNPQQLEAAAILQLEMALGVMAVSPEGAQIHFELGEKLLRSLAPTPAERRVNPGREEELHRVWSTWFGVAASGYMWVTDVRRAAPWIRKARQFAPRSSSLRVIEGSAHEIEASGFKPDQGLTNSQKVRTYFERNRRLELAQASFRAAVAADPLNPRARIRLGRILFLFGKIEEARQETERGRELARKPDDIYLAALFLGAIKERLNDLAGARLSYAQALTVAPRSQTVIVALAHLDLMSGRPDRAQSLARAFASAPVDDHVWWAYKNGGLDHDGLATLRERVRQ